MKATILLITKSYTLEDCRGSKKKSILEKNLGTLHQKCF